MRADQALALPDGPYVLVNLILPSAFSGRGALSDGRRGMVQGTLGIADGRISAPRPDWPLIDACGLMALPPFVDAHVHLDKAYTVRRSGLGDGSLLGAIRVMSADVQNWTRDDLHKRMGRGMVRALAHGSGLVRTHLDTIALPDDTESWDVLADLQAEMSGALKVQPVALAAVERADQADFDRRCQQIARRGGVLGAFIAPGPVPHGSIRRLLAGADRYGLDVDFHVDENLLPGPCALATIADIMIETRHQTRVVAGHCCNLSLLEGDKLKGVLARVAQAGIHIVALPTTNTFLQDRRANASPRRRGIAPLHEIRTQGIPICTASDNVQDAFYPFGDFDMLEVLRTMIACGHLDQDLDGAMALGLDGGALAMGQAMPRIELGGPADFTCFRAQDWLGLLAGTQAERLVLRGGRLVETGTEMARGAS